jgi:hypothetical protein
MHHISILIDVYMYKTAEAYGSITTATHLELCDQTALVRTCNVPRNQPDHVTNPIKFSVITTT